MIQPSLGNQTKEPGGKNPQRGMKLARVARDAGGKCYVRRRTVRLRRVCWRKYKHWRLRHTSIRHLTQEECNKCCRWVRFGTDGAHWAEKEQSPAISPSYSPPPPSSGREKERARARWRIYGRNGSVHARDPRSRLSPSGSKFIPWHGASGLSGTIISDTH